MMTPDEQRIAIAKACGWKFHPDGIGYYQGLYSFWMSSKPSPNYLNDLNAMHEAEKVLTATQLTVYRNTVAIMNGGICIDDGGSFVNLAFAVSATAAQRAEAFLRTLGLWTATPPQPQ
jgi:hypothetical protein